MLGKLEGEAGELILGFKYTRDKAHFSTCGVKSERLINNNPMKIIKTWPFNVTPERSLVKRRPKGQ